MKNLPNYDQVSNKFSGDYQQMLKYIVLIEAYEKHIDPSLKDRFINSSSIEDMLKLFSLKQLEHLKKLLNEVFSSTMKATAAGKIPITFRAQKRGSKFFGHSGDFSSWFKSVYDNFPEKQQAIGKCCSELIDQINIVSKFIQSEESKQEQILSNYKSNLAKFDGNSVEYRKYLILLIKAPWIESLGKVYDINKVLSGMHLDLNIELLEILKNSRRWGTGDNLKINEPYLYKRLSSEDNTTQESEKKAFDMSYKLLCEQVEQEIENKKSLLNQKAGSLKIDSRTYEDASHISSPIKTNDMQDLASCNVVSGYSGAAENGSDITCFLRKKVILKDKVLSNYKSNLAKFDGDSVEYRKYIILSIKAPWIKSLGKVYDIRKILRNMSLDLNIKLLEKLNERGPFAEDIKKKEPYFLEILSSESLFALEKDFKLSGNLLIKQVEQEISNKETFLNQRINDLKPNAVTYEDILEVLMLMKKSTISKKALRNFIPDYLNSGNNEDNLASSLRARAALLELINNPELFITICSRADLQIFRDRIMRIRELMSKNILSKSYTVYRGIRCYDALRRLFKNGGFWLPENLEDVNQEIIDKINRTHPVIFDTSVISTSLNKGISSVNFSMQGGCLFKISLPAGCKAIILDFQGKIKTIPAEEEVLLDEKTELKITKFSRFKNGEGFTIHADAL